jgi:hypothetical protein
MPALTAVHAPVPAFRTETLPTETEKTVTVRDGAVVTGVVEGLGVGAADVDAAVVVEDAGGGFVVVITAVVVLAGEPGALVVVGVTVFAVQLNTAVKIKKDRTAIIKALPVIILFNFILIF